MDCYNESEELTGLYTMIEDNVALPFTTRVLDVDVEVEELDLNGAGEVVAVCRRGRSRQRVLILDLLFSDHHSIRPSQGTLDLPMWYHL